MDNSSVDVPVAPRRRLVVAVSGLVVAIAAAVAIGLTITDRSDNDIPATPSEQLTSARQACSQWSASIDSTGRTGALCSAMTGSMSQQMHRRAIAEPGTSADPDQLLDACQRWISRARRPGSDDRARCDQMIAWMTAHMGDWDNGMMNGPMMGP